jgi:Bacterial Ig-like domain
LDVTPAWSAGDTVLTCTPTTNNWPAQTQVQWVLSGTDVDGNPSPPPFGVATGLFTTGTGGGTTDTNPPVLVLSTPTNNATGVPLNRLIRFTFNEAMQAAHSILWSANLTEAKFAYSWSGDARTLTCQYSENLPTNAIITWKLNPSGSPALFKDAAGNALAADVYAGSFTTTNTIDLCNVEPAYDPRGSFSMYWQVTYVQTGNGTPIEDTNSLPSFSAFLNSPTNNPVASAQVGLPGGSSLDLTNFFGTLFLNSDEYASQAQLDASRPPGNYTLHVNRSAGGSQSLTLNRQVGDWPPTPQILNLPALQSADATVDVVVQWNGFTGAGQGDSIGFTLMLGNVLIYNAPDPCVPIVLEKTATSITLPRGLLVAGRSYDASLRYFHFGAYDTNTIADIVAFAGVSKDLNFTIVTGGGVPAKAPTIGSPSLTNNQLQFQVTGASPGQSIQLQESITLQSGSWTTIQTVPADASGAATFTIPITSIGFYRLFTP